jgi:polyhydroxybutyrate depolymerase
MALKKYCVIALVIIMAMMLPMASSIPVAAELSSGSPNITPGLHTGWMTENYTDCSNSTWTCNRTFEYYIPTSYTNSTAFALLFSFHGLGSNGDEQRDLSKFDVLAKRAGFIAVFPDSTNLNPANSTWKGCLDAHNWTLPDLTGSNIMWNCGAINGTPIAPLQYVAGVDDAGFVADIVDWFKAYYAINASRIYATGMSNGAMFSYFLAFNLSGTFSGIAPVCGTMDLNLGENYTTTPAPTTVIVIRSPTDPIVPEAGECSWIMCNNFGYSTNYTIDYWKEVNGISNSTVPQVTTWGPTDNITTTCYVYSGGTNGTQVILLWEVGCQGSGVDKLCIGHTWPGGLQYGEASIIGLVDNEIDGSGQIWKYLPPGPKYYLRVSSAYGGSINTFGEDHYGGEVTTPGEGSFFYAANISPTVVNLVATPVGTAYEFTGWTGDVGTIANRYAATTIMTIYPNTDYQITANFQLKSVTPPTTSGGGGCFIATAAYGTPTAKQLDVLRAFRDDVLLKSTVGSRLVDFYYQTSPPIANFISQHSVVRTLVRELLIDPIVWIVQATGNMWQS